MNVEKYSLTSSLVENDERAMKRDGNSYVWSLHDVTDGRTRHSPWWMTVRGTTLYKHYKRMLNDRQWDCNLSSELNVLHSSVFSKNVPAPDCGRKKSKGGDVGLLDCVNCNASQISYHQKLLYRICLSLIIILAESCAIRKTDRLIEEMI